MSKKEIIREIARHIELCGGGYSDWYVGITDDAKKSLFNEHAVIENKDAWICRQAESNSEARSVGDCFVNRLETCGDMGSGNSALTIIYAYKKVSHTKP